MPHLNKATDNGGGYLGKILQMKPFDLLERPDDGRRAALASAAARCYFADAFLLSTRFYLPHNVVVGVGGVGG